MPQPILKPEPLTLDRLNVLEYVDFFNRVDTLIAATGAEKLGIEAHVEEYRPLLAELQDLGKYNGIKKMTVDLTSLNHQRNKVLGYLLTNIRNARNAPFVPHQKAYHALRILIRPFKKLSKYPHREETAAIFSLISQLSKPETARAIATLNQTATVEELEALNKTYADVTEKRTQKRTSTRNSRSLRTALDPIYRAMVTTIMAKEIITPSEDTATFLVALNGIIRETKSTYKERRKKD